jgi:hypothetical protein
MQSVVAMLSGAPGIITPVSYEVMPFLARFAAGASRAMQTGGKSVDQGGLLATVLAGSMLVSVAAGALGLLLAQLPLGGGIHKLLPPALQAGLFGAIGWGLYTLSFETLGLDSPGLPFSAAMLDGENMKLWLPAHVLGIGLWLASRVSSSPLLFPGFVAGVTVLTHLVRLGTGTSLAEAQHAHWLMVSTRAPGRVTLPTRPPSSPY